MITAAVFLLLWAAVSAPGQPGDDFAALLVRAEALSRAGQIEEAEQVFEQAIGAAADDNQRAQALWMLANARRSWADAAGAVAALERALALTEPGPWLTNCLAQLAVLAPRQGRADLAQRADERLVELLGPTSAQAAPAMLRLARGERDRGDLKAAIERLELLLSTRQQSSSHVAARELLVECLLASGESTQALTVARAAPEEMRRARLLMRIAQNARRTGDFDFADAVAREVLDIAPDHLQAMKLVYDVAVEREAVDQLVAELRKRAEGDDPDAALRFLARVASWEGDDAAALAAWQRLAELYPEDPDLHQAVGAAALKLGDMERAESELRKALELDPAHRGAADMLAEVLVRRGRSDEAVEVLKCSVNYDPTDEASVRSLGYALSTYSLHHEAVRIYEEARRASGDGELFAWEMARAQIGLLNYRRATEELLVALRSGTASGMLVARELERLAGDEIAREEVLEVLARQQPAEWPDETRAALARAWLAAGETERALALLSDMEGGALEMAQIARESDMRGRPEVAAQLYVAALEAGLPQPEASQVTKALATIEMERGRWQEALTALTLGAAEDDPEALMQRFELLLYHARRPDEAGRVLDQLTAVAGDNPTWTIALRWARAEWLFISGRLDEAEAAYSELLATGPAALEEPPLPPGLMGGGGPPAGMIRPDVGGQASQATLRLGEIALRRGELGRAREYLRAVAEQWPDSDEANDALSWLSFLRENLDGEGQAEVKYLAALGLVDRGEFEQAESLLEEIAIMRGEPLAEDALMLLAEARYAAGDVQGAVATWLEVAERFPESLPAPEALLRAARSMRDDLGDMTGARAALQMVLERHQDTAAARWARDELELLRETSP